MSKTQNQQRPTANQATGGQRPTIEALLERIEALEQSKSLFSSTPEDDVQFDRELWKAVVMGAVSELFAPGKIPNFTPKAVDAHMKRALAVAEQAVETAKSYRRTMDKIAKEKLIEQGNDPLKSLMSEQEEDDDLLDALKV